MNESVIIDVRAISPRFSTRTRGQEAYDKLAPILNKGQRVVLDLDNVAFVSPSFLDAIVLKLIRAGQSICFKTKSERTKSNLERIVLVRKTTLDVCDDEGRIERLKPGPF